MSDDLFSVKGKRIVLTGGTTGIGRMMTEGLAERGARVFTASRKQAAVDELLAMAKDRKFDVAGAAMDLSGGPAFGDFARAAAAHFDGAFDVLINNAGATWGAPVEEYPESGWDKVFDLNVKSLFYVTQQCLPYLRKAARETGEGRIVNIGSVAGFMAIPDNAWAYAPAKAAVHQLTKTLAKGLVGEGITVNAIAPGLFPSKMTKHLFPGGDDAGASTFVPIGRPGRASDIVGTVIYLVSRAGAFTTGIVLPVDGGALL